MGKLSCSALVLILVFNLSVGAWCFDYVLFNGWGVGVPWYKDVIFGLFLGEFTAPLSIVFWVLRSCGVPAPFFH